MAVALVSAALLSACSGRHRLHSDELKSAATEIVSIASEGELFASAAAENRAGAPYAKGHPEYLRKQVEEVAKELSKGQPEARDQAQFDRLHQSTTRLMDALDALPPTPGDRRWQRSQSQFETIRREAEEIRRTL